MVRISTAPMTSLGALVILFFVGLTAADPETVEGLYLTKKSAQNTPLQAGNPVNNNNNGVHTPVRARPFQPATFASGPSNHRRAFGNYLSKSAPKPLQPRPQWNNAFPTARAPQAVFYPPRAQPPQFPSYPQPTRQFPGQPQMWSGANQKVNFQPFTQVTAPPTATPLSKGPKPAKVISQLKTSTPAPEVTTHQTSTSSPSQVITKDPLAPKQDLNKVSNEKVKAVTTKPKVNVEKKNAETAPKPSYLKAGQKEESGANLNAIGFTGEDKHKAALGVLIGVVFVAVFVGVAIGLAAQCTGFKAIGLKSENVFSSIRTPTGDDATPPELRGNGAPTFVQPGGRGGQAGDADGHLLNAKNVQSMVNEKPYFSGKLILHHDPPGLTSSAIAATTEAAANKMRMTQSLLAAQTAALMPSPAEQVTDDLVSPKYEEEDDPTEDEEDSDDTVYECPGLAANARAMGDMVVKNPFYLQGHDLDLDLGLGGGSRHHHQAPPQPQPISNQSSIFHHGFKGVN